MTKGTPRASKPRQSATKSPPKAGTKAKPGASEGKPVEPASRLIDQRIRDLGGWRGETLARMRALIVEADPEMTEEWKWGTPVWSHQGIVSTGEAYTKVVKLTFARGARIRARMRARVSPRHPPRSRIRWSMSREAGAGALMMMAAPRGGS